MKIDNPFFYLPSSQLFPFVKGKESFVVENDLLNRVRLAKESADNNLFEEALTSYNELIAEFPNLPFLYACRSIIKTHLEEDEGAFYDYQVAKRLDFNYHLLLEWINNSGQMLESDELEEMIANPKEEAQYFINRATMYVQHFEYENAILDFNEAYRIGQNPVVLVSKGAVNMRMVRYDEALGNFNTALAADANLVQAYIFRAKLYAAIKEFELADNDFNQAVLLSNEDVAVYEERAQFYELMEKLDLAIADYSKVIAANSDDFYVYVLRADLYEKLGQLQQALDDYNSAIELNPYYSDLYQYRGGIRQSMGDCEGAADDFRKFEELEDE